MPDNTDKKDNLRKVVEKAEKVYGHLAEQKEYNPYSYEAYLVWEFLHTLLEDSEE